MYGGYGGGYGGGGGADVAEFDERRKGDEGYVKSYFNLVEANVISELRTPVPFVEAMRGHLRTVCDVHDVMMLGVCCVL